MTMTMTIKQRHALQAALEARARLSSREHDRGCRIADRIVIVAVAACIFAAYLAVRVNDDHTEARIATTSQAQR
jgi:fatty acid desaturase